MGQQVSIDIRSRLEQCTLEELLTDDKYVEELKRHLPTLPKESLQNLAKIVGFEKDISPAKCSAPITSHTLSQVRTSLPMDRNTRTYKLGSLWAIKPEDIRVPQTIADSLKQDYFNLLRRPTGEVVGFQSLADYYDYTYNFEITRSLSKILWRFLTVTYYDLVSELDATKERLSSSADGGVAFVVAVICQTKGHDPKVVRQKVTGWVRVGRRYRRFMDSLSAGCLVLFPEKISDLVWEQYVPADGELYLQVIEFLQHVGIVRNSEEEGWNEFSERVLHSLSEPFRTLIPFQFQPVQQPTTKRRASSAIASTNRSAKSGRTSSNKHQVGKGRGIVPRAALITLPSVTANSGIKRKRRQAARSALPYHIDAPGTDSSFPSNPETGLRNTPPSLGVIQFDKHYLERILLERPADVLGDIWFGSLPGLVPFVSLRLSEALGEIIKPIGREVFIRSPTPDADRIVDGVYSIKLEAFVGLIGRDGFGGTFWNEVGGKAFVSLEVMDKHLISDFFRACEPAIDSISGL